ncbi:flavin monoamine oxidase family protein [Reichenbachiella versicolor]|uniref:flavin monoamine oxidase family protein n=1 Tax=Reichenbachiella versicolor TaxID=1821036 RepID=UPI000D6E7F56|nr:NAD(P)/FAD-dependent oxidoreductase [Reichenbachiella versicolor]
MVIIIGAGLSGLLLGYRLKQKDIPFKILEARDRIGGRIHTVLDSSETPLEMGATWFGEQHVELKSLLDELGIEYFEQFMNGTAFFQPISTSPASSVPIPSQPPSYRIKGGTSAIVQELAQRIGEEHILLNENVKEINFSTDDIQIISKKIYRASKVILALPPKLWATSIKVIPDLPQDLKNTALNTHTWMEHSIKVALSYQDPFWRTNGQSGTFFSNSGPISEFYDHCNSELSKYALCGFLNPSYAHLSNEERKGIVLNQIVSVFGDEAKNIINYEELNWLEEDKTYSESVNQLYPHENNGSPLFQEPYFDSRLYISSTESSSAYSGYMEGAVISANLTLDRVLRDRH